MVVLERDNQIAVYRERNTYRRYSLPTFEKEMGKENAKTKKWLKWGFIPLGIGVIAGIISSSFVPAYIGLIWMSGTAIVKMFKDCNIFSSGICFNLFKCCFANTFTCIF